jgi:hypothetical protein
VGIRGETEREEKEEEKLSEKRKNICQPLS